MSNLVSTAPYVYQSMLGLVQTAAAAQTPAVQVFPFELAAYEPASYVLFKAIENQRYEFELIGSSSYREYYDICGLATVFTGATVTDGTIALDTMFSTYAVFNNVVSTPVISNIHAPVFNNAAPNPGAVNQVYVNYARYEGKQGDAAGGPGGWAGVLEWSFSFVALVTPA